MYRQSSYTLEIRRFRRGFQSMIDLMENDPPGDSLK